MREPGQMADVGGPARLGAINQLVSCAAWRQPRADGRLVGHPFITTYRKRRREPQRATTDDIEDWQLARAESHTSSGLKSAESVALERLPDSDIKRALHELPEGFRITVYLADVEGFSYREIAGITGTSIGTVMSRLHRGRLKLRHLLRDYAATCGPAATAPARAHATAGAPQ
jgi:RNA polymerase sigma-70 factor, ECF subfamily